MTTAVDRNSQGALSADDPYEPSAIASALAFIGNPAVALLIGIVLAVYVLLPRWTTRTQVGGWLSEAAASAGLIILILITGAGGALGQVLRDSGVGDELAKAIREALLALKVFGTDEPRLAVAAVNSHGGENGAFGNEEIDHIAPACEAARAEGLNVHGPVPADSVFHQGLTGRFDGVLSQYHDQGHIAAKTFDFDGTISVTVGLPILRTSVDHGTAFESAGSGKADHATMLSAYLAGVEYSPYVPRIRATYGG